MSLSIKTEWTSAAGAPDLMRETAAELTIEVEGQALTRNFDHWSKTVTERARLSAYPLAAWLAHSWWRLSYESAPEAGGRSSPQWRLAHDLQWRLAHDLPAAGGGYVWPRVRIASDGEAILVSARASSPARWEPAQYLTELPVARIPRSVFDREVDGFLVLVLERLRDMGADFRPLASLWEEVSEERADPEVRAWRELEARLGFFADEAPEPFMNEFAALSDRVGKCAADEIAPVIGTRDSHQRLQQIIDLSRSTGIEGNFPLLGADLTLANAREKTPWERGRLLATAVREAADVPSGPVSNESLCHVLGSRQSEFEARGSDREPPLSLGVRRRDTQGFDFHFRKRNMPGRRFEAARFIADGLVSKPDTWLPQTDAATARQQLQRAFAAEFLMPIGELQAWLGDRMTANAFEDAAEHFGVSPLAVSSHLANHGLLPVEAIWTG
jgi:hypothetical protein